MITNDIWAYSFDINQNLSHIHSNAPFLEGLIASHENHYPIRIKPDDIWLLIVQAFSHHVNANSEELRYDFVNFDGKKELIVTYNDVGPSVKKLVSKEILEDFSIQINTLMKEYLGEELLDNLTPDFSTTDYDSDIIFKISIMGAFKKYFDYTMLFVCGNPYIIIEGTAEDYEKIIKKANKLKKYKFGWYIDRIIPLIEKMVEAKKGNIDVKHFKKIIAQVGKRGACLNTISFHGWFLNFFAYETDRNANMIPIKRSFIADKDLRYIASQMLNVPFKIITRSGEKYSMEYKVGFIGCDQNEKGEVFPVKGWIVSEIKEEEKKHKRTFIS